MYIYNFLVFKGKVKTISVLTTLTFIFRKNSSTYKIYFKINVRI